MRNQFVVPNDSRGFSLIEVMIAASIAGVLLLSLASSLMAIQRSSMASEARSSKTLAIEALRSQLMHKQICMKSFVALPRQFQDSTEVGIKLGDTPSLGDPANPINNTVRAHSSLPLYSSLYTESLVLANWQEIAKPNADKTVYSSDLNWAMMTKKMDSNEATARQQLHPTFVARVIFEVDKGAVTSCYMLNPSTASNGADGLNGVDTLCEALGGTMKDKKCIPGTTESSSSGCYNHMRGQAAAYQCAKGFGKPIPISAVSMADRSKYNWTCSYKHGNGAVGPIAAKWKDGRWVIAEPGFGEAERISFASNIVGTDCSSISKVIDLSTESVDSGTVCAQSQVDDGCVSGVSTCIDGSWNYKPAGCANPPGADTAG